MTTESQKASSGGQEHVPPHPIAPYPQPYNAHFPPPPPGAYPPYYAYAPMPDGAHDPNAPNGAAATPYLMAFPHPPPGMIYAYPAPGQPYPPYPAPIPVPPSSAPRPKRKQVKMACTNCAGACKRCDEARPCERCVKYGIADTCVDGVRKERKKGIKRGPYKRKNRTSEGDGSNGAFPATPPSNGEGEAVPPQPPYPIPPEGYYPHPYFYPPPGYVPPPQDGQSHPEGQVPPFPYHYPMHPVLTTFPGYPGAAPVPYPPPVVAAPGQVSGTGKEQAPPSGTNDADSTTAKAKKRRRRMEGSAPGSSGAEPRALVAAV